MLAAMMELEDFVRESIRADKHPEDDHMITLFTCPSCRGTSLRLTIEHHTGSEEWNFRGIIHGECADCGYLFTVFTFTGEHRKMVREERPECECGHRSFITAMCERFEGEEGIPGFFDEGVIAGKCNLCGRNRVFLYTD